MPPATILKNVLAFTGLGVGVPSAQPHLLKVNSVTVAPKIVLPTDGGYTITADATNVTVTRTTGDATVNVYVEYWHSIEDVTPPGGLGSLVPFIVNPGGGGSSGVAIENEGAPVAGGPFTTLDFVGAGVTATDGGGGTGTITISSGGGGLTDVQDEGTPIGGGPFTELNFIGAGVLAIDQGGGVAGILIAGAPVSEVRYALPEQWSQQNVPASQTNVVLSAQVSPFFNEVSAVAQGSLVGIVVRSSQPIVGGTLSVSATINGVPTGLSTGLGGGADDSAAQTTAGTYTYFALDRLGVVITTNAGFLPLTADISVWLQVADGGGS